MANSRSSSPASGKEAPASEQQPTDEIQACPAGYMAHTPPPTPQQTPGYPTREELAAQQQQLQQRAVELRQREERLLELENRLPVKKERKLPMRSGSTASLFSPFASLSRRLGAKHKASKASGSVASGMAHSSRMSTPVDASIYANCPAERPAERPARSLASIYSTFPRKHSSSGSSASGRFINQLVMSHSGGSSSTTGPCPSCPSPSCSSSSRLSGPPFVMTEILDEPAVEEEVS